MKGKRKLVLSFRGRRLHHGLENSKKIWKSLIIPNGRNFEKDAASSGHGDIDFFADNAFTEFIKRNMEFHSTYDLATWCVITPLSEKSIEENGSDSGNSGFYKGRIEKSKPVFRM